MMNKIKDQSANLKSEEQQIVPLSFFQQPLWFLEQLAPGSTANIVFGFRLSGHFDVTILRRALNEIVYRHEILRTTIITIDNQPMQRISSSIPLPLTVIDRRRLSTVEQELEIQQMVMTEYHHRVDFIQGPLFRTNLLWFDEYEYCLFFNFHHIICDDWSLGVFIREILTLYRALLTGLPSPLSDLSTQYSDFVRWQRDRLQGELLKQQGSYWRQQLEGMSTLELPTDPLQEDKGNRQQQLVLSQSLSQALKVLSQQKRVTWFMTILATLKVLLYRYTEQEDISVGTFIANRNFSEFEEIIGLFINTLILRTDLSGNPTFNELLMRVSKVTLGAYAHQDIPFDKMLEEVRPKQLLDRTPLFRVLIVQQQNAPPSTINLPNLSIQLVSALQPDLTIQSFSREGDMAPDLVVFVREEDESLVGRIEYNAKLFEETTIKRMISHFKNLLESIVANPNQRLSDLSLLTEAERYQQLDKWTHSKKIYPSSRCIHNLFEEQVKKSPDKIACLYGEDSLTYKELDDKSEILANLIQKLEVENKNTK